MISVDTCSILLVLWLSFSIRSGEWYLPNNNFIFWMLFSAPVLGTIIFSFLGLYRSVTRFVGFKAVWNIFQAVTLYSLVWGIIFLGGQGWPRSVVLINWILAITIIVSLRFFAKWLLTHKKNFKLAHWKLRRVKGVLVPKWIYQMMTSVLTMT